ncbi:MAG TPA: hypothetical protein VHG33_12785, partial [Woeseiaceae bacterium]|nr:hypothetical protein [Woeseiaceae bacterium]
MAFAALVGFVGYGVSLVLFVLALRHLGTARTGAYFFDSPFHRRGNPPSRPVHKLQNLPVRTVELCDGVPVARVSARPLSRP